MSCQAQAQKLSYIHLQQRDFLLFYWFQLNQGAFIVCGMRFDNKIELLPAASPDLKPIGNVWDLLVKQIHSFFSVTAWFQRIVDGSCTWPGW
jgi:hypothetical protein